MPNLFAYGSLTAEHAGTPARLRGYRRIWGVAMDNAVAIPGYKRYRDGDGAFPHVCVAFLDLAEAPGATVEGLLLELDDAALTALDARERNYERADVTGAVDAPAHTPAGRVFAYLGRADSRARLRRARRQGRAVVTAGYVRSVERWGLDPDLPTLPLRRVAVPDRSARADG